MDDWKAEFFPKKYPILKLLIRPFIHTSILPILLLVFTCYIKPLFTVHCLLFTKVLFFSLLFHEVLGVEQRDSLPQTQFPEKIVDINGRLIDVGKLTEEKTVTVVTLKATWCPVCQEQLIRLKNYLNLIDTKRVTFLVLSPGPKNDLLEIKKSTGFPYPFIEDKKLRITKSLGLDMSESEITPSIFILNKQRNIRWMQRGRSGWYYGDKELLNEIGIVNWM